MAHPLNTYSDAVERLLRAAEAMNNAFGGDTPAWLRDEASTLADACRDMRRAAIPLDRYIGAVPADQASTIAAAARDVVVHLEDALTTHVYSAESHEVVPVDCPALVAINRARAALGMEPSAIEAGRFFVTFGRQGEAGEEHYEAFTTYDAAELWASGKRVAHAGTWWASVTEREAN